ncbi:Di-copper centre-containing protein [Lojkania enalia]|uniref:Di-copper centre-containing protein n=1 Tax=Lojkania enalia TaxID=147567 RepID=A0A9P4N9M9_9PLEO|nr:Di-copper centre-containing protein [Didymosphaeria enalia]
MRLSFSTAVLAAFGGSQLVAAAPQAAPSLAPKLPMSEFEKFSGHPISLEDAKNKDFNTSSPEETLKFNTLLVSAAATCSNPRIRTEWDSLSNSGRQAFVSAVRCLMGRPASGQWANARNRYEDLVALHQALTPNVHSNSKFLIWHRYLVYTFEDILRDECGFTGSLPWFDESRYAGRFAQSSIFSGSWFGGIALGGNCVTDGQFARTTLNVGPGPNNTPHCLARNGDASKTANTNSQIVSACNARTSYADMAACSEGGAHAWGHNGIGAVMSDVYASPGDPVFWLHHGFIDRNFRIWQNVAASRRTTIDGTDRVGNRLTLDTIVSVNGMRPNVRIGDILDTMSTTLCYKYNY